jgi:hypothetical protein
MMVKYLVVLQNSKIITPTVFYNSLNPPPANKITGLLDYVWDAAPQNIQTS